MSIRSQPRPHRSLPRPIESSDTRQRNPTRSNALAYDYNSSREPNIAYETARLSPPPPYEMYDQQGYGQPTGPQQYYPYGPDSYRPPHQSQNQPYGYTHQPWASNVTLSQAPPQVGGQYNQGWQSSFNLVPPQPVDQQVTPWTRPAVTGRNDCPVARGMNQGAALCDNIAARLGQILGETDVRHGDRQEDRDFDELEEIVRELSLAEDVGDLEDIAEESSRSPRQRSNRPTPSKPRNKPSIINFQKTWMYANSRLPPSMYPFRAYFETWRIICMAARASSQVYERPRSNQREHYIDANWRHGTKAMVLKSSPIDDKNLIVFAIRGSQKNFMDWAVNFRPAPTAPEGFLDDEGNACHAGFLAVAKAMVAPVAARLRQLLEQNPSRCSSSLLITGHSAGGAVASLLFMHMLATRVESELTHLTGCFKRVHCVTFGAPPVTFLPLEKPKLMRGDKSIFLAFANEGDPIVRADKEYIFSLARLLAAPSASGSSGTVNTLAKKVSKVALPGGRPSRGPSPAWRVPPATLSNAGRVVVLREKPGTQKDPVVEAVMTTDEQLRDVVFGDPAMHMMALYRQRVEKLGFAIMMGDEAG